MLSIKNLSKTYAGGIQRCEVSRWKFPRGCMGWWARTGRGLTLMEILATLLEPDEGTAQLNGLNLVEQKDETRKILGYLPQEFGVYPKMPAQDLLEHLAVMKGITNRKERKEAVEALLQQTNLWDSRKKPLGSYSGGMKQRFGIAQALLANPKLIIVDEPTAGLDPAERNRFLNLLSGIGQNVVVILSTHIVEDVRELCSRMAIISEGQLLLEGVPNQTIEKLRGKIWKKVVATDGERDAIEKAFRVISTHLLGGLHEVRVYSEGAPGDGFALAETDLEDVYFYNLTNAKAN